MTLGSSLTLDENFVLGSSYYRRSRVVVHSKPNGHIDAREAAIQHLEMCTTQRQAWALNKSYYQAELWLAELLLAQSCDNFATRVTGLHRAIRLYLNFFWTIMLGGVELPLSLRRYLAVVLPGGFENKFNASILRPNKQNSATISRIVGTLKQEYKPSARLADLPVESYLAHNTDLYNILRAAVGALLGIERAVQELAGLQMFVANSKIKLFQEMKKPVACRPHVALLSEHEKSK